jgi:hypothetical protein
MHTREFRWWRKNIVYVLKEVVNAGKSEARVKSRRGEAGLDADRVSAAAAKVKVEAEVIPVPLHPLPFSRFLLYLGGQTTLTDDRP